MTQFGFFDTKKIGEMQESKRIAKKTGDKSKETGRFDKFVINERFAFINRETGRYKPKPGDLEGLIYNLKYYFL